jgi:RNA polymerase sigma-70 factor (ECF subfamily)
MLFIYLSMINNPVDVDIFNEVYHKYRGKMYRVAYYELKNKEDAEDAVQEAFVKVAKNISKINEIPGKKTEAFLVIVIRNTARDIYRKNHRERGKVDVDEENDMDTLASPITEDILSGLMSREGYKNLVSLIGQMSDTYKGIMKLRFVIGCSNSEIAELLGINKRTVECRISRGRAMLAEMLRKEDSHVAG